MPRKSATSLERSAPLALETIRCKPLHRGCLLHAWLSRRVSDMPATRHPPLREYSTKDFPSVGENFHDFDDQVALLKLLIATRQDHARPTEPVQHRMILAWNWGSEEKEKFKELTGKEYSEPIPPEPTPDDAEVEETVAPDEEPRLQAPVPPPTTVGQPHPGPGYDPNRSLQQASSPRHGSESGLNYPIATAPFLPPPEDSRTSSGSHRQRPGAPSDPFPSAPTVRRGPDIYERERMMPSPQRRSLSPPGKRFEPWRAERDDYKHPRGRHDHLPPPHSPSGNRLPRRSDLHDICGQDELETRPPSGHSQSAESGYRTGDGNRYGDVSRPPPGYDSQEMDWAADESNHREREKTMARRAAVWLPPLSEELRSALWHPSGAPYHAGYRAPTDNRESPWTARMAEAPQEEKKGTPLPSLGSWVGRPVEPAGGSDRHPTRGWQDVVAFPPSPDHRRASSWTNHGSGMR